MLSEDAVGYQAVLSELAKTEAFSTIVKEEMGDHSVSKSEVLPCIHRAYDHVSQNGHGDTDLITVYDKHHTSSEVAAMVCFLRLQERWDMEKKLQWREEVAPDYTKN